LADGDVIELDQALRRRNPLAEEDGIEAFQIGQHDELFQGRMITHIAFGGGMSVAPLLRGLAEEGDVEEVGLVGGSCSSRPVF
jgi:hypothetical protein